jgi:hypothetical protein
VRRRRAALVAGALAVLAIVLVLVARGGGGEDALAGMAPADALGWVHVSPHAGGPAWALAGRFPALRGTPDRLAGGFGLSASRLDLARDVRPWVGDEAGLAWLPDGRTLLLADVADRAGADAALRRLGARPTGHGFYALPAPGAVAALAGSRLAAGPEAAVRAAIARAGNGDGGLAGTPAYRHAMQSRSGDAPLGLYAPAAGVQRLVGSGPGLLRTVAALLNSATLDGIAADAEPVDGGVRVHVRLLRRAGAPTPASFAPGLLGRVPLAGTVALLDLPSAGAIEALAARLGAAGVVAAAQSAVADEVSVDLERDVIAPLRGEAALSLQARGAVPLFTLVARTVGPPTTREALARLQAPLARRLTGSPASVFSTRADGTFTLPVTTRLQPSYGLDGDVLVATTAQPGLDQMHVASRGIAQSPALAQTLGRVEGHVQALGFFDLHALLDLVERTGLAAGPGSAAVGTDLEPIEAAGAVALQDPDHPTDTTAELFLQIP